MNSGKTVDEYSVAWESDLNTDPEDEVYLISGRIHEVEAPVLVRYQKAMHRLELFLLRAVDVSRNGLQEIDELLHLGRQVLRQMLESQRHLGTVEQEADGNYKLTEYGRRTLEQGMLIRKKQKRRVFHFLDGSFVYLEVTDSDGLNEVDPPEEWSFSPGVITEWINAEATEKRGTRFPKDVVALVRRNEHHTEDSLESTDPAGEADHKAQDLVFDKHTSFAGILVIRNESNGATRGEMYFLSNGQLRTTSACTIHGEKLLDRAFPETVEPISLEEVQAAWDVVAKGDDLETSADESTDVSLIHSFELAITVGRNFVWRNSAFICEAQEGKKRAFVRRDNSARVLRLSINPGDDGARELLQMVELVRILESHPKRNSILADPDSVRSWVLNGEGNVGADMALMQQTAWKCGFYELAYQLSEQEDMRDASVQG